MSSSLLPQSSPDAAADQHLPEDWCISIKTVGGGFDDEDDNLSSATSTSIEKRSKINSSGERLFSVTVSPEDEVSSLYQEIEGATGVKASQQRLIYRGRIINDHPPISNDSNNDLSQTDSGNDATKDDRPVESSSGPVESSRITKNMAEDCNGTNPRRRKIKDIVGLCDGQTIHLVKKREAKSDADKLNNDDENTSARSSSTSRSSSLEAAAADLLNGSTSGGGNGGGAFLAALLGLGNLADDGSSGNDGNRNNIATAPAAPTTSSWRSSRRNRRPHYRLSAADLQVPDPGSMEPVRQGLMTLHTLLPHSELHRENGRSPLEANREWFRGQWLDCRDTVNQWLEATVVEILRPQDILPLDAMATSQPLNNPSELRRPPTIDHDPAVSSNDLEGRRRLLLEPCQTGDPRELSGDLAGYRPRANNDGVQLLLIHYNGWPHRWDEWIRSDSERIRPFRTRTRHPDVSNTASPTPQSVFTDAPRTNISFGNDERDRSALLPELSRALSNVNNLMDELVQRRPGYNLSTEQANTETPQRPDPDLPWIASNGNVPGNGGSDSDDDDYINTETPGLDGDQTRGNIVEPLADQDDGICDSESCDAPTRTSAYRQGELRHLAAIVDRLGRTLTDAAPQIASLAASMPEDTTASSSPTLQDSEIALASGLRTGQQDSQSAPLGGLLSLWSRERRRQSNADERTSPATNVSHEVDPDHIDFASGLVNTTRGEVRSGPRSRSSQDDVANLLGAYLAAASLGGLVSSGNESGENEAAGLGRLLARGGAGGGDGGGIDIHIHAVVTTGGTGGGTGLIGIGGAAGSGSGGGASVGVGTPTGTLGGATARSLFSPSRSSRSILRSRNSLSAASNAGIGEEVENDDLFSELYSENPTPVDPSGSVDQEGEGNSNSSPIRTTSSLAVSDTSSRITFDERTSGSFDSANISMSRRVSNVPRRRSSAGRRSSTLFRLFRRRRSSQNGSS